MFCGSIQVVTKVGEVQPRIGVEHQLVVHDLVCRVRVQFLGG
jgi:hypothetical protein